MPSQVGRRGNQPRPGRSLSLKICQRKSIHMSLANQNFQMETLKLGKDSKIKAPNLQPLHIVPPVLIHTVGLEG